VVPDYGRDNFVAHIESDIDHPTFGTLQGIVHEVIGPGGGRAAQFFGGTDTTTDALHCTDTVSTSRFVRKCGLWKFLDDKMLATVDDLGNKDM
jgi:hypothetical protein